IGLGETHPQPFWASSIANRMYFSSVIVFSPPKYDHLTSKNPEDFLQGNTYRQYRLSCTKKAVTPSNHKSSETKSFRACDRKNTRIECACRSSPIQTILSVLESHQILTWTTAKSCADALADYTADREFHPALKIFIKLL